MSHRILVASYTNSIHSLSFDSSLRTLNASPSKEVGFHPSWVTSHPDDHSLVFACLEQQEGKIIVLRYDDEGNGSVLSEVPSAGGYPCSLLATKDELFVANYAGPASVASFSISTEAPYIVAEPTSVTEFTGSGPHKRQDSAHAHQAVLQNGELFVADLGTDRVYRLTKEGGSWKLKDHVQFPIGAGARHIAFYEDSAYTVLELTSEVTKYPNSPSIKSVTDRRPTLSNPQPYPNNMLAAEILIPKPNASFETPYIYISNRNDPSPEGLAEGDSIAIFTTDLELVAEVRTGLKHIRGMEFGGEDGRWLVAGGMEGGGVKVFERVDGGKSLREVAHEENVEAPNGFAWL